MEKNPIQKVLVTKKTTIHIFHFFIFLYYIVLNIIDISQAFSYTHTIKRRTS